MIKKVAIALALPCLTALGVVATGQLGSSIGLNGQASLFATIAYSTALKIKHDQFIAHLMSNDILSTPQAHDNDFTRTHGAQQLKAVILEYYNAAWKKHDAEHKLACKGFLMKPSHNQSPFIKDINASFGSMIRHMAIEQVASVLEQVPYQEFNQLTIPYAAISPIITGTLRTSQFMRRTLYKNKLYVGLKPIFDACDQRIEQDWKHWNQKIHAQTM